MDISSIQIKFIPLVKTFNRKKSICYLEIIPELSSGGNIDKLEWKKGEDLIEYVVPMYCKIVLKKVTQINSDNPNKIYYSCVDLLHTTSVNKTEIGSGDISRIVSDNIILKKIAPDIKNSVKYKITSNKNQTQEVETEYVKKDNNSFNVENVREKIKEETIPKKSVIDLYVENLSNLKRNHDASVKTAVGVQIQISKNNINANKVSKSSGDENGIIDTALLKLQSIETLTNLNAQLASKLTFCSFDANVKPPLKTVYQNNSFFKSNMFYTFTTKKCVLKETEKVLTDNSLLNYTRNIIPTRTYGHNAIDMTFPDVKDLPALRFSHFIQHMEKEMLPLRILLNEILNKCIPLGLIKKSHNHINSYASYSNTCSNIENCSKFASNRVVYSVVFNK